MITSPSHTDPDKQSKTRLEVGDQDNAQEKDADAIADQIMMKPNHPPASDEEDEESKIGMRPGSTGSIRMNVSKNGVDTPLQMHTNGGSGDGSGEYTPQNISDQIADSKGSGTDIDEGVRQSMSQKMGTDLTGISVHTGSEAARMNKSLGSKAFTHGSDIYFNQGQYKPSSHEGRHLLAHELTHVLQQTSTQQGLIQRQTEQLEVDPEAGLEAATGDQPLSRIGALGRIGARPVNYSDIVSTGKKIYSTPIPDDKHLQFKLTYNEIVEVVGVNQHKWAFISSPKGHGWVQAKYVEYPLPDFKTELHFVQEGEMLKDVLALHYSKKGVDVTEWGADVRLYVHATALLNKNRAGIGYYEENKENVAWYQRVLLDETGEETQEIWNTIYLKSGHNIWLPSVDLIESMKAEGAVSGGSVSHSVVTAILEGISFNLGLNIGVLEGLWTALVDTLTGIVDLITLVGDLIQKLINGELTEYLLELYEGMKQAIAELPATLKKMWEQFMAMSPFDKGRAIGKIIGMILFEVLLAYFTAGAVSAIKWAGKGGKHAKAFSKLPKLKGKADNITKHVEAPDPSVKKKIDRGLEAKTTTKSPKTRKADDIEREVESKRRKPEDDPEQTPGEEARSQTEERDTLPEGDVETRITDAKARGDVDAYIRALRDEPVPGDSFYVGRSWDYDAFPGKPGTFWKPGDPIDMPSVRGEYPTYRTARGRYWRNRAYYELELRKQRRATRDPSDTIDPMRSMSDDELKKLVETSTSDIRSPEVPEGAADRSPVKRQVMELEHHGVPQRVRRWLQDIGFSKEQSRRITKVSSPESLQEMSPMEHAFFDAEANKFSSRADITGKNWDYSHLGDIRSQRPLSRMSDEDIHKILGEVRSDPTLDLSKSPKLRDALQAELDARPSLSGLGLPE